MQKPLLLRGAMRVMASTSAFIILIAIFIGINEYTTTIKKHPPNPGAWYWLNNTMGDYLRISPDRSIEFQLDVRLQRKYVNNDDEFVFCEANMNHSTQYSMLLRDNKMALTLEVRDAMDRINRKIINYKGNNKPFNMYHPTLQLEIFNENMRYISKMEYQYKEQKEVIEAVYGDYEGNAESSSKRAIDLGNLERMYSSYHKHGCKVTHYTILVGYKKALDGALFAIDVSSDVAMGIQHILAELVAVQQDILENEENEGKGFQVVFLDCPVTDISRDFRTTLVNELNDCGDFDLENIYITMSKQLIIEFETNEGRAKCLKRGKIIGIGMPDNLILMTKHNNKGTPSLPRGKIDSDFAISYSVFVDFLAPDTSESQIETAMKSKGHKPTRIKKYANCAFVDFGTEEEMKAAAGLRRIKINGRKCNTVIAKARDFDETKGIMGIWRQGTPSMNAIYKALDELHLKFLYLQCTFYKKYVNVASLTHALSFILIYALAAGANPTCSLNSQMSKTSRKRKSTLSKTENRSYAFTQLHVMDLVTLYCRRNGSPKRDLRKIGMIILMTLVMAPNLCSSTTINACNQNLYNASIQSLLCLSNQHYPFLPQFYIKYMPIRKININDKDVNENNKKNKVNVISYNHYNMSRVLLWSILCTFIDITEAKGNLWDKVSRKNVIALWIPIFWVLGNGIIKYIKAPDNPNTSISIEKYKKDFKTIATLNVNGLRNKMDEVKEFIIKQDIDIMCIQETHLADEENYILKKEFRSWGFEPYFASKPKETLIKEYKNRKIEKINRLDISEKNKDILKNEIVDKYKRAGGIVTIVKAKWANHIYSTRSPDCRILTIINESEEWAITNIYAPTGDISKNNLFFEMDVYKTIKDIEKKQIPNFLIAGDFNATIDNYKDRWSNFSQNTYKRIFKGVNKLIEQENLIDTWRYFNGDKKEFTWQRTNTSNKNLEISNMRLDIILTNKNNIDNCITADIPEKIMIDSDHKPVLLLVKNRENQKIDIPKFDKYEGKISVKERDDETPAVIKEWMEQYRKDIKRWQQMTKSAVSIAAVDLVVNEMNKVIYKCCLEVYGEANGNKIKYKPLNNKEIGILKKEKRKITNLSNYLTYSIRTNQWENKHIEKLANKAGIVRKINKNNITNELKNLKNKRKEIQKNIYKMSREDMEGQIKIAAQHLIEEQNKNPKSFYNKLNGKEKTDRTDIYQIKKEIEGKTYVISKPEEVVEEVGQYWTKLFQATPPDTPEPKWLKKINKVKWNHQELIGKIDMEEIKSVIKNLKKKKAAGSDKIPNEFFMDAPDPILHLFMEIYNKCLELGKIPEQWKEGIIHPIFKKGDKFELTNFRPIALLQTQYKIYSAIINNRISKQMKSLGVYSRFQGAWQKNKLTTNNVKVLINILEDAKEYNKELHTLFIDITKAYDSVEHWGLLQICERYGMNKEFTKVIASLIEDTHTRVITQYGLTKRIQIGKGVRQGDVISPTLFILWLNPLLDILEKKNTGYKCRGGSIRIPILAFADDLAICAKSRKQLLKIYNKLTEYCTYYHMDVSPSKSGYMHLNTDEPWEAPMYKNKPIKIISDKSTYKYLGCEININLNWDIQKKILEDSMLKHVKFICAKKITSKQKVLIINIITQTKITYRMYAITFDNEWLEKLDNNIAHLVLNAAGFPKTADKEMLWTNEEEGGWGLKKLANIQKAITITSIITYSLNIEGINKVILLDKIKKHKIDHNDSLTKFLFTLNETNLYIKSKAELTSSSPNIKLNENNEEYTWDGDTILAFTDGSLDKKNGSAGAGIFFSEKSSINKCFNVPDCCSSLQAELYAIAFVTGLKSIKGNIRIITDNLGAIDIIRGFEKYELNLQLKTKNRSVVRQILNDIKLRKERNEYVTFEHIFSHIEKKMKSNDKNLIKKIEERKLNLGYKWNTYIEGNEKADKLANKGRKSKQTLAINNKWRDAYVVVKNNIILEDNIYKYILNEMSERIKEKYYNKPKRGIGWRNINTNIKNTVEIAKPFKKYDHQIHDFIFKNRQLVLHNRERLHQFNRNSTGYAKEVYNDNLCKLCDKNEVDTREHWRTCAFSKKKWEELYENINETIRDNDGKDIKLWFGDTYEGVNLDTDKIEYKIATYDRTLGNTFFVPNNVIKYFKKKGIKKPDNLLREINRKHVKGAYLIYKERIKKHAKIMNIDKIKEKHLKEKKKFIKDIKKGKQHDNDNINARKDITTIIENDNKRFKLTFKNCKKIFKINLEDYLPNNPVQVNMTQEETYKDNNKIKITIAKVINKRRINDNQNNDRMKRRKNNNDPP